MHEPGSDQGGIVVGLSVTHFIESHLIRIIGVLVAQSEGGTKGHVAGQPLTTTTTQPREQKRNPPNAC